MSTNIRDRSTMPADSIQTITEPMELFTLLYRWLEIEGPYIAVNARIIDARSELFEAVSAGRTPQRCVYWHEILHHGIVWTRQADEGARRCSLGMLIFLGHVGQFMHRNPGAVMPITLAIEMLACIGNVSGLLIVGLSDGHTRVRTTSEGSNNLGVQFDLILDRGAGRSDCWDWDGHNYPHQVC